MDQKETYHEGKVFELLENWERAEAPEYFETRILSRLGTAHPPKTFSWGWVALAIILVANGVAMTRYMDRSFREPGYEEYLRTNPEVENYYSVQS